MPEINVNHAVINQEQYLDAAVVNKIIIIETDCQLGFLEVYYLEKLDSAINFRLKTLIELHLFK